MIKIIVRYYEVDNQGNKYMHAKRFNSDDDARGLLMKLGNH